jgi:hypothetical protein
MDTDLDTLVAALYVRVDDLLKDRQELIPPRPRIGLQPKLSDAELVTMSVLKVLLVSTTRPAGSVTPRRVWVTCSHTCPSSPGTTSGRARRHPPAGR